MGTLITALDLGGTFVFAISGALVGARRKLDIFGVLVLAFVAATAGGIARDAIIGATPAASIADWRYPAVCVLAGLVVFYAHRPLARFRGALELFDAMGLALFAVTGTTKAFAFGLGPVPAILLGVLTAVGGGMARDMLVAQVPMVLQSQIYAVAALLAAIVVALGHAFELPAGATALVGAALCLGLRIVAMRRGWNLPAAK